MVHFCQVLLHILTSSNAYYGMLWSCMRRMFLVSYLNDVFASNMYTTLAVPRLKENVYEVVNHLIRTRKCIYNIYYKIIKTVSRNILNAFKNQYFFANLSNVVFVWRGLMNSRSNINFALQLFFTCSNQSFPAMFCLVLLYSFVKNLIICIRKHLFHCKAHIYEESTDTSLL